VYLTLWKWTGIFLTHYLLPNGAVPQGTPGALMHLENGSCSGAALCAAVPANKHCPMGNLFLPGLPCGTENVRTSMVLLEANI